jgi:hypothetical protein
MVAPSSRHLRTAALCLAGSGAVLVLTIMVLWTFPFAVRYLALPSAIMQVALSLVATVSAFRHPSATAGRSLLRFLCTSGLVATGLELALVAFIQSVLRGFSQ